MVANYGCNVNSRDDQGDSLLHYAVNMDNKELESWLLNEVGLSKDVKNKEGLTPYGDTLHFHERLTFKQFKPTH